MKQLLLLSLTFSFLFFQKNTQAQPAENDWEAWAMTQLDKQEVYIGMRDGVRLFTSVYTPKDTTKQYPILMIRTPYCVECGGPEKYSRYLENNRQLIEAGYIFAFQDVRGKFMSEGEYVDIRPHIPNKKSKTDIDEASDTYDSIDWLLANVRGNNGRVGVFGISYPGFYSTTAIMSGHPALRAVSPQGPVTNWFIGDDFHHNGAFFMMDAFRFYSAFGRPRPEPTRSWAGGFEFPNQDNYQFFLELGAIKNSRDVWFSDTIQFWNDVFAHPDYDDFWKARDPLQHLHHVRPAVLTVGGWFDAEDSWGPQHVYWAIEKNNPGISNRLLMGPWYHGQWSRDPGSNLGNIHWGEETAKKYKEMELKFFNYYLKDEGKMDLPEATLYVTGENEWRAFETWPPQGMQEKTLYFQPNGKLSFTPSANGGFDEYVSDPMKPVPYTEDVGLARTREYMTDDQRFASRRPDVMVYQTEPLTEDVTIAGPITPDLWVSTTGTDADYVVKLIDVFPDDLKDYPTTECGPPMPGYQMMVRGDIIRGRYRNSFESPEAFKPGQATKVKFEMPGVAHTFKKGHRIMVQVQNSWFPLVDRNPQKFVNIYECSDEDFQKATHRIYFSEGKASGVKVMVLE